MNSAVEYFPNGAAASVQRSPFDDGEFKDLYEPPATETQFLQVQRLFEGVGYAVRRAEMSPHGLPVAYVRMRRKTAPLFADRRKFREHIKQILKNAPSWFSGAKMDAQQDGRSVLVSFVWERKEPLFTKAELEHEFLLLPP